MSDSAAPPNDVIKATAEHDRTGTLLHQLHVVLIRLPASNRIKLNEYNDQSWRQ